jgi:hypothetical protein
MPSKIVEVLFDGDVEGFRILGRSWLRVESRLSFGWAKGNNFESRILEIRKSVKSENIKIRNAQANFEFRMWNLDIFRISRIRISDFGV